MAPANVWHGHGEDPVTLKQFDMDYRLWLENVTWGQGTTSLIPPPTDLRVAATAAELEKMWECQVDPCDPLTDRALVWDWVGDPATIEGYLLYRFYSCPGQDAPIAGPAIDAVLARAGQGGPGLDGALRLRRPLPGERLRAGRRVRAQRAPRFPAAAPRSTCR